MVTKKVKKNEVEDLKIANKELQEKCAILAADNMNLHKKIDDFNSLSFIKRLFNNII